MSYNTKNYAKQGGDEWVVNGILRIKGANIAAVVAGNCYYVDSGSGSDLNSGENWNEALATIDAAIGKCTANNGDRIFIAPGHVEDIVAAGGITVDVAGVEIFGVGIGNGRPKLTFKTSTAASLLVTAASVKIANIIGIAGIDALTNPIHVQAADCLIDIDWRDDSSTVEAARALLGNASADRLKVYMRYFGQTGGDACVNAVRLVGTNDADIYVEFYGLASTSVVEFHTTPCTNVVVKGRSYNQGTSNFSKIVVDTVTGSTWSWQGWDGEACSNCSGGQDAAIAGDDIGSVSAAITAMQGTGFDTATDSLKILSDVLDEIMGAGFATGTDGLKFLSDVLDGIKAVTDLLPNAGALTDLATAVAVAALQADLGDPSTRTNLQSLLAMLGNPDESDASIWNAIIGTGGTYSSRLGKKVTKAKADTLDGVQNAMFTISGGKVLITNIVLEVCDAQVDVGANATKIIFNPTVGSDSDLTGPAGDLNAAPVGTIIGMTGTVADDIQFDTGLVPEMAKGFVLAEGTIDLLSAADGGVGGATISAEVWYIPVDAGAFIAST